MLLYEGTQHDMLYGEGALIHVYIEVPMFKNQTQTMNYTVLAFNSIDHKKTEE